MTSFILSKLKRFDFFLNKYKLHFNIPWINTSIIFLIINLIIILTEKSNLWFSSNIYLWGILTSSIFFMLIHIIYKSLPYKLQWITSILLSFFLVSTLISNYFIYKEFGHFLNASMINFIFNDLNYIQNYISTYGSILNLSISIILFSIFILIWFPQKQRIKKNIPIIILLFFCSLLFIYNLELIRQKTKMYQLPMITSSITGIAELTIFNLNKRTLVTPLKSSKRTPITHNNIKNLPNILVIINESFGKNQGLPFYNSKINAMPLLTKRIKNNSEWILFKKAFTNSTATDVSVPSMLTGVNPIESNTKLHSMPLIWDWAKANNKYTFLLTSQRYSWGKFNKFFFSDSLDIHLDAESIEAPIINDLGIDDTIMIQELPNILKKIPNEQGFIGVINTNALHSPYQKTSQLITPPDYLNRYQKALFILDYTIDLTISYLNKYDLNNTIIIITSDHGEASEYSYPKAHRIYSFYDAYFKIPFLMYIPKEWSKNNRNAYKNLVENSNKNIQNLDIIPTLIDILKLEQENQNLVSLLKGKSLLKKLNKSRPIIGINTNDNRWWDQEGFGIAKDNYRMVVSTVTGIQYTNINKDPFQQHNNWQTEKKSEKEKILSTINKNHHLNRIWKMSLNITTNN